jgi:HD-like signal output (HDOD) protein
VADSEVEIDRLARIISQDPGLSARIVGLANSAYFGQTQPINSVQEAIIRVLGLNTVKALAISVSIGSVFRTARCAGFDLPGYWFTAIGCATLARMLANHIPFDERPNPDAVYLSGLLHNVGWLILAHGFPLELAKLLRQQPAEQEKSMEDLQRENIGIDWIGAGEWLAHRWHLPEGVSQIIASLANHECDSEYNLDSCLIQGASLWLRKSADGESVALSNIEALQEVPGLDKDVLVKVEEKFLGESEELHVLSRLLS